MRFELKDSRIKSQYSVMSLYRTHVRSAYNYSSLLKAMLHMSVMKLS